MKLFSVKCTETHKVFNILGIKIKIRRARKLTRQEKELLDRLIELYELPAINRDEVASKVENMRHYGLNTEPRNPRIIVTLTSYPKRMYDIHLCLYSLLTQDFKPDKVVLWLGEDQFPDKELDVPRKVKELCQFGLEIRWCKDMKSFTKLIPSLKEYPDDYLVTADDDMYYPQDWLGGLWQQYQEQKTIVAYRTRGMILKDGNPVNFNEWPWLHQKEAASYRNFLYGVDGVLYPPHCLHPDVLDIETAMKLCPKADDIWFWLQAVRAGTKIYSIPGYFAPLHTNPMRQLNFNDDGTLRIENEFYFNEEQFQKVYSAYPDFMAKLRE